MIGFRPFVLFSVLLHALLFGICALDLWTPPEIHFVPPQGSVKVSFAPSPAQANLESDKEKAEPVVAESLYKQEAPADLPASVPAVSAAPRPDVVPPKASLTKKAKKEAKKKRRKIPPATKGREEKKKEEPQTPTSDTALTSPEPEKELVIGKGNAPSYARFLPPDYPAKARRQNIQGKVLLRVLVDREGRAAEIKVVESSHPEFTRAARTSARRSRYVPMTRLGQPIEAWVLIPFHFQLR